MRTKDTAKVGSAGQSIVKGQLEKLGWGAVPNPEHDLGTDLWLMPRDDRGFDWGLLCGAQVKTSPNSSKKTKYFKTPKLVDGEVTGWVYYEEAQDHFQYWISHAAAHFLVLHDLKAGISYWELVTADKVEWTDKGGKILVPRHQTIDETCLNLLLAAASTQRSAPGWEGSAWTGAKGLAPADQLRYALLAPRLIASHPNLAPSAEVTAVQAIATLVLCRFEAFNSGDFSSNHYPQLDMITASSSWSLRLFAALYGAISDNHVQELLQFLDQPPQAEHERAAAATIAATFYFETGDARAAAARLATELDRDRATPVDHAWLQVQSARAARELGQFTLARSLALEAFRTRLNAPEDPTCLALSAAASQIMFSLGPPEATSFSDAVIASDTAVSWWRSQLVSWGLTDILDISFKGWAQDGSITFGAATGPIKHLRAASLISGLSGDHPAWGHALSMLARCTLLSDERPDRDTAQDLINDLRLSGDRDNLTRTVKQLLWSGPTGAVSDAAARFALDDCTRSTLLTSLELIIEGADELTEDAVLSHIRWAMQTFENPSETIALMRGRLTAHGLTLKLFALIRALLPIAPDPLIREVIDFALRALTQPHSDNTRAELLRTIRLIPSTAWESADIDTLRQAGAGDGNLRAGVDQLFSGSDPAREAELMTAAETGNPDALRALPDLRRITPTAAAAQIPALRASVLERVQEARQGRWSDATVDHAWALTIINMSCPEHADWSPIVELLTDSHVYADDIDKTMRAICARPELVPEDVRVGLVESLRSWAGRFPHPAAFTDDIRGAALETMDALVPGSATDAELWTLMGAGREARRAYARILMKRAVATDLGSLLLLAHDRDPIVQGTAAFCIARWAALGIGLPHSLHATFSLINAPGGLVARQIANALDATELRPELRALAEPLVNHPSAFLRRWARSAITRPST